MRLILVRHGETQENLKRIIQGQTLHGRLTKKGKIQSKKVAQRLKIEKIDVIFSSDSGRAKATAFEILKKNKVPVFYRKELREIHRGAFEGKVRSGDYEDLAKKIFHNHSVKFPEGESVSDVKKRASKFLRMLHKKYHNKTVVLVSHAGFFRILVYLLDNKIDLTNFPISNASLSIIEFDEDKRHKFHLINDTSHLN